MYTVKSIHLASDFECIEMPKDKVIEPTCIIYEPKAEAFPQQEGPLCYYYSLIRAMQFQENSYEKKIPEFCNNVVNKIMDEFNKNRKISSNEIHSKIDLILNDNLTNEMVEKYCTEESSDSEDSELASILGTNSKQSKKEQFMETYSRSQIFGLFLQFQLKENNILNKITIEQCSELLRTYGPMPIDGNFACNLDPNDMLDKLKYKIGTKQLSSYDVDDRLSADESISDDESINENEDSNNKNFQHTVLLIGCQQYPTEEILYIDPNYPNLILSISFDTFKEKVNTLNNEILVYKENNIKPTIDTMPVKRTAMNDKEFSFDSSSSEKNEDNSDSNTSENTSPQEVKKPTNDKFFKSNDTNICGKRKPPSSNDEIDIEPKKIRKLFN